MTSETLLSKTVKPCGKIAVTFWPRMLCRVQSLVEYQGYCSWLKHKKRSIASEIQTALSCVMQTITAPNSQVQTQLTIAFYITVNHKYDNNQRTLKKDRNPAITTDVAFWSHWSKFPVFFFCPLRLLTAAALLNFRVYILLKGVAFSF